LKIRTVLAGLGVVGAVLVATAGPAAAAPVSHAGPKVAAVKSAAIYAYNVNVKTSDLDGAGTDATVQVRLHGSKGTTGWLNLDSSRNDLERGAYETFSFNVGDIGSISSVDVWFDHGGDSADWSLDYVTVTGGGTYGYFPHYNWLRWAQTITINNNA
jgi:hypothetical protein